MTEDLKVSAGSLNGLPWINPVGGLGDALMLSGVLKQVVDEDPGRRFNLVERTKYWPILKGHPAIAATGCPPPGAEILRMEYWSHEDFGRPGQRAFQILARMFGLRLPAPEHLFIPGGGESDPFLEARIPWADRNVLISPTSESPRKQMAAEAWERMVDELRSRRVLTVQVGRGTDRYIRGAYSLLGLTTPRQAIGLLRRFDAVVTCDNFIMHAAHLVGVPAVVLWGPTDYGVYGYEGHIHLSGARECPRPEGCIGPRSPELYAQPCPLVPRDCMNRIDAGAVLRALCGLLEKPGRPRPS